VHTFGNPVTQCSLTSRNVVFLNRNYADYYKLTPENVGHLIAAVKNDNTEEFDEDEDEDNPNNENPFINMYPHMDILDAEPDGDNDKDSYDEDDLDLYDVNHPNYMPPHVQARLIGPRVPREIHNLQTFYNPNPGTPEEHDENELLEAAVYAKYIPKREMIVRFQEETALLATMFDSNPEPKSFHETQQTQDYTNWWEAMTTKFQNMEQKRVWELLPKTSIPANQKVIGCSKT
jgi:hypothetical protein